MRLRKPFVVAVVGLSLVGLAACSSPSTSSDGPVELTYWSWGANIQDVVDQWNSENPDIQVKYTDAGGGSDSSAKLVTAARAGNAPDVALVEYTTMPAMIVADVPADITEYIGDAKDAFTEGTWAQTTFGDVVYGIPQDVGPMAFVYRQDRFQELDVAVPATWQEFRTAAEAIKAADPTSTIAALPPAEFGFWAGVSTQAGGEWWSTDGEEWAVGIADEPTLEVADFFEELVKDGLVSTDALLTPEYNAALSAGTILSWPSAVWAPSVIESVVPDTAGSWAMAPLPQWTAGDAAVPYQGGSALVVTTSSKHPAEAAEFAKWLNASKEGNESLINTMSLYPAAIVGQEMTESNDPPALMPQQADFYTVAAEISSDTIPVTWGPNVNLASSVFTDELQKAIDNGTPWRDAFIATQKAVIDDMVGSGFKVAND